MHNCDSLDPLVTPFVDGELPDDDRRAVEDHLRVCPACRSRVTAERSVHDLVRARRATLCKPAAPDALHACCAAFVRAPASQTTHQQPHEQRAANDRRSPRVESAAPAAALWPPRLAPFALAASLVVVVGGAFVYQATDRSTRVLAAELVADHAKCFAMNAALGTRQLPAAVEESMASGFDWRMHLPDNPTRAGLELVGARPCLYGEGRAAHIMYRHDGHPVSLFMLPHTSRTAELVDVFGHEAAIWCANNRTFVLIAREPRADVERLASFVQTTLH